MYKNKTGELIEYQNRPGFVRRHVKIYHTSCANGKDPGQPVREHSLIRFFPVRIHNLCMDPQKSLSEKWR